ncbi:PRC-barrel domain-containing protein [Terrarubrum flagellatum]|uniref:PRC-barrel domain-containing protein n=1 Tax=Terrirubrum flagellatum TaxID=2895980 RepID=UPI003144F9F0
MTRVKFTTSVVAAALLCGPAFAQTTPPTATPDPAPKASAPAATPAPNAVQMNSGQWLASKLPGVDVYNATNDKIGSIAELLLDQDGKINAVVISVGGFLGMGKHDVAIPLAEVKFSDTPIPSKTSSTSPAAPSATGMGGSSEPATTGSVRSTPSGGSASSDSSTAIRGYPDHATVNLTAEQLKATPAFKYGK